MSGRRPASPALSSVYAMKNIRASSSPVVLRIGIMPVVTV
jgi:hypothetical protein